MATIKISNRGAKRIRKGHLWVYRSDVRDAGEAGAGAIVEVVDEASNFVGQAFYSDKSEITLRFLSTAKEEINRDWWRSRLRGCAERRATIARETNAYRLVYSEGDLLPSIIVDVYDGHHVVQTLSQGSDRIQNELIELLVEEFQPKSIVELNDARVRQLEELELRKGLIWSAPAERSGDGALDADGQIEINQHGVRFVV
jgi:23S rRNA (cytosine1962-C5)-methyltransferase